MSELNFVEIKIFRSIVVSKCFRLCCVVLGVVALLCFAVLWCCVVLAHARECSSTS